MKEFLLHQYPQAPAPLSREVVAAVHHYAHGERATWHQHQHGQLVMALRGVVRILTPTKTWTLPHSRALWLPSNIEHELHAVGDLDLCSIYIESSAFPWQWNEPSVIQATGLIRELALVLSEGGYQYTPDSSAALSVPLLLKTLAGMAAMSQTGIPLPKDKRLLAICEHMMNDPGSNYSLDLWGERFGASGRTLARRFKSETGISFAAWRQHMRVAEAITRLTLGQSLTRVAGDLGYSNSSNFIVMFRQTVGESPQRYLSSKN